MAALKAGVRLGGLVCTTEVVVVRAPVGDFSVTSADSPMVAPEERADSATHSTSESDADGVLLGKRYISDELGIELLCTKSGPGPLAVNGQRLELKTAKALPASD